MNLKLLEDIGLTKSEIKVYFALLELGQTTSGPVITKSGVARSKVYENLERLKQKGLVNLMIEKNTKYFQAAPPERIKDYIKRKEEELANKQNEFDKLLPDLKLMQNKKPEDSIVKAYSGFEGVKSVYKEILQELKKGDEYLVISMPDDAWEKKSALYFFKQFHLERGKKGIKARVITTSKKVLSGANFSDTKLYQIRYSNSKVPGGIAIFKDRVVTIIWGDTPYAFSVENKKNALQYKEFFEEIWKKSK